MASNILVHNGIVQPQDPGPAPVFLRSCPPGVYTTTRTSKNRTYLLLWERHLQRLAESIQLMSKTKPDVFPSHAVKLLCFNNSNLKSIVEPSLSKGLAKANETIAPGDELTVTTYVSGLKKNIPNKALKDENNGVEVYVLISRYNALNMGVSGRIAIMGPGRKIPNVKHSEWVRSRQVLEKLRPKDVTEIVLSNDGDLLLEGMVSNFFVVIPRRINVTTDTCETLNKKWENIVLQTAPLEGVLPGVIRKLILEICEEQGILYEEMPPSWRGRQLWLEAFTSNSVRMIEPVGTVQYPLPWDFNSVPETFKDKLWETLELEAPGQLSQFIQEHVEEKQTLYGVDIQSILRFA